MRALFNSIRPRTNETRPRKGLIEAFRSLISCLFPTIELNKSKGNTLHYFIVFLFLLLRKIEWEKETRRQRNNG